VHQGDLVMFRSMVQYLLNIEQFCPKNQQIKTKYFKKNWGKLLVFLKIKGDFLEVIL
jgi:hypothetical protein